MDHAVEVEKFSKVVIASSDTNAFVCTLYDFIPLMYSGLEELWMISGKCDSIKVNPVHTIDSNMDNSVVDVLPAVHALTGCDTTCTVDTNVTAFKAAMKCNYGLLYLLGKSEISNQMILSAENFLVECNSKRSARNNFDKICFETYHQKSF